ncbi:hypothetical protein FisN_14Lh378 [Fistulifera solaris]|uniref:Uncharacterized protein n=1 Tax=Fistulifera solaris TaxID=1519565 RepID=A0A1Z5JHY7_FISSO|nr:hypothetical protein FisN_14Lh378 [Fistulifera solaris]|eukprot:GAX13614.1 hypothetical protein FisN_14Lh378 [Fistulifera solaris]
MADDQFSINAKSTAETLGEETQEIRQYPLPTPQRARSPLRASVYDTETPLRRNIKEPLIPPSTAKSRSKSRNKTRVRRKRRIPGRDFQHPQDMIAAPCITVSLPHRVAFERNTLSLDEKTYNLHAKNKRSPSLGHLYWIQRLQSVTKIRQVQFQNVLPDQYQAILPDTSELPSPAPTLSHKKIRLPHRADVGFPNATPEEIESKQIEIRNETVQEEASLRLIALVADLGRQVAEQKIPERSVPPKTIYSILTPPLQSIPSTSQGWRPRLFHDRPSFLEYLYVHCEAPDGCLALYNRALRKVSEDFWYSKGQKGIFGIPSGCEETLLLVWRPQQAADEAFGVVTISYRHWPNLQEIHMSVYSGHFTFERLQSIMSGLDVTDSDASVAKKKGVMGRMFRTPQKPTKTMSPTPDYSSTTYKVRISFLGGDFLQPLLSKPEQDTETTTNRLLADVSGDFAVALDKQDSEQPSSTKKKRSHLLRLPKATQPAAYFAAAEFREVLYLPASPRYDYDRPFSYWSLVNLMYLYPRVLQITSGRTFKHEEGVSIHMRACKIEGEHAVTIAKSFYSTSSQANLLDEVNLDVTAYSFSPGSSVVLQDEYKLRLPVSLDKRFVLQVLLLSSSKEIREEVQVPLCSYSSTKSGKVRALTLIPNGIHRLKLGDFQLQLESRLVSAVHVSDPCVAAWLRDCPQLYTELNERSQASATKEDQFDSVLSEASESAVLAHFRPLFYSHLWNFTQGNVEPGLSQLSSFFDLLDKSKQALGKNRLPNFIKSLWDEYDEIFLTDKAGPVLDNDTTDKLHNTQEDFFEDDNSNESQAPFRNNKKGPVFSRLDKRRKDTMRALMPSGTPFSRTAYGASKTDRMRLEAELQLKSQSFALTPFFEDDETIATMPSVLTDSRSFIDSSAGHSERFFSPRSSHRNIIKTPFPVSTGLQSDNNENEFATRVKTVAKVILAPCVGPSFSSILSSNMTLGAASCFETQAAKEKLKEDSSDKESKAFCVYPGSDDDQSRELIEEGEHHLTSKSSFRGVIDSPLLRFSLTFELENQIPSGVCEYVYESIIIMWLRAWLDHVELIFREQASTAKGAATFSIPPYKFTDINAGTIFRFYGHMDLLLPLCLKSFIFRYTNNVEHLFPPVTKVIVDHGHMLLLEPFAELLARGLVGEVLSGLESFTSREESLQRALQRSDIVLDFLIGLVSFLHPEHSRVLVSKFLHTLRNGETEHLGSDVSDINFRWDEESLHRVRCCREIRIHTIEALLMLPAFVNLNYPLKYSGHADNLQAPKVVWLQQYQDCDMKLGNPISNEDSDCSLNKLPQSGWLAELLIGEGLSVSSLSSEAIVAEAIAQLEVTSTGSTTSTMSLRKRPGATLSRDDLLMLQSLGLKAISVVYELGFRRHALDRRYQSNSARERTAALFASVVMNKCLSSVKWLSKMDPTQKIRSLWLLSFIFVLQEAPDSLLRHYLRRCCDSQNMRIHRFVRLLRLCSATFQTFTESHGNFSPSNFNSVVAPWLLQESFNTICATAIMIIEECIGLTSNDPPQQEKLLQGILDLLLNVLTSPQSSVTHLRVAGGALQVLETFGAPRFVAFVGQNLQHWIRILISLMNSVSLSKWLLEK